jgi:hypothetical protein
MLICQRVNIYIYINRYDIAVIGADTHLYRSRFMIIAEALIKAPRLPGAVVHLLLAVAAVSEQLAQVIRGGLE